MSVINQVLNQLEQRGAHTAPEQTLVRAVPPAQRNFTWPLLAFGVVLIAGIVAWRWAQQDQPALIQVAKPEVVASSVAASSIALQQAGGVSSPAATPIVASAEVALGDSGAASSVPVEESLAVLSAPASRLSLELSLVMPPSTAGQDSGSVASTGVEQPSSEKDSSANNPELPAQLAKATATPRRIKAATPKNTVVATPAPTASGAAQTPDLRSPMKQVSPAQQADAEFRKATAFMQQGRIADALAGYEAALRLDAGHDAARRALVALLLENKRGADAEHVLLERLQSKPEHTLFTLLLARLQFDRGAVEQATTTLEKSLPYAKQHADYHAFLAALLQRQSRNEDALTHYQIATQLAPNNGAWLMGYGISLQAVRRDADAKAAFKKALDTRTLSPELQAFVQRKIKEL